MDDLISRQAVFNTVTEYRDQLCEIFGDENELIRVVDITKHRLIALPSARSDIENNHVNLCDSCSHTYPDCNQTDVIFGDGVGHDNICCCGMYQPERKKGKWIKNDNGTYSCDQCRSWIPKEQHYYAQYCLYCGADMRGEQDG